MSFFQGTAVIGRGEPVSVGIWHGTVGIWLNADHGLSVVQFCRRCCRVPRYGIPG